MPGDIDEEHEKYLRIFNIILESQKQMLGDKVGLKYVRKAPLELDLDDQVVDYYGKGEDVLDIMVEQYEEVWGKEVADRKIGRELKEELDEEDWDLLTDDLRAIEERKSAISQIKNKVFG